MKRKHFILALVAMLWSFSFSAFAQETVVVNSFEELKAEIEKAAGVARATGMRNGDVNNQEDLGEAFGDVQLGANIVMNGVIEIPDYRELTLDLNGYTISGDTDKYIRNLGTLTILDGSADQSGVISCAIYNGAADAENEYVYLGIEGGTFKNLNDSEGAAITNYAECEILSGRFFSEYTALVNHKTMNIDGGTEKNVYIEGKTYSIENSNALVVKNAIIAGTEDSYRPSGSHSETFEDVVYYNVAVNGQGYTSLTEAVEAAADGDLIRLFGNIEENSVVTIDKAVILDGNGKSLTTSAANAIKVAATGTVSITDITVKGASDYALYAESSVKITESTLSGGGAVEAANGTITIQKTDLVGTDKKDVISVASNVTFNLEGGNITASAESGDTNFFIIGSKGSCEGATFSIMAENITIGGAANYLNIDTDKNTVKVKSTFESAFYDKGYVTDRKGGSMTVYNAVANVNGKNYRTLAEALTAATDGATVKLLWADYKAPIAMAGTVCGKTVTITGTANVDWSKGWLYVGRNGAADGKVIFDNANLAAASASPNSGFGINVSGRKKDATDTFDGTVEINNSTIGLDFLINKGTMSLDNSTLTVKNGFATGGRPASETESGVDATATMTLNNSSKLVVNNHNGMGLGYEAIGVMNIDATSTFETTQSFLVTAKGTMNVNGGTVKIVGTLTNNGTVYATGAANLDAKVAGAGWFYMNSVNLDADTKLVGAKVGFINGENTVKGSTIKNGFFSVGIGQNAEAEKAAAFAQANGITMGNVVVNVSDNAVVDGNGESYSGWVGSAYSADKTQHTYALNVKNSLASFGYMHVSKDGTLTVDGRSADNNRYTNDNANVNFYAGELIINGVVTLNNADAWAKFTKMSVDATDGILNINGDTKFESSIHNGGTSSTSLKFWEAGKVNVAKDATVEIDNGTVLVDGAELNIAGNVTSKGAVTGNGTITLTDEAAVYTAPVDLTVGTNIANKMVVYNEGAYKVYNPAAKIGDVFYLTLQNAIDAAVNGDVITFVNDVTGNVTLTEKVGLYYTIDGAGKTMNGTITITPLSDENDNRRITIKGINFENTADAAVDFISCVVTNHYPRLTVEGCTFTGNGKNTDVALRLKTAYGAVIKDCTGTGLHSFLQNTAGKNFTIENVTVTASKSAFALGTVQGVTIKGCTADVQGYGIRLDAQYDNNAVIESNKIKAFIPVVVRRAEVNSNITVQGTNTMTADNTDKLWCAVGTSEYEKNGEMPTAATAKVEVTLTDTGLDNEGIYGDYVVLAGQGTEENPYLINDIKELVAFRDQVNQGESRYSAPGVWVALAANIDLADETWTPIGNVTYDSKYKPTDASKVFSGVFNGNGKVISNLKVASTVGGADTQANVGLFGITGEGAVIKDLTLTNVNIETDGRNVGAIAGFAYKATLSNITVNGDIQIKGGNNVAGIAGMTRYYAMSATDISVIGNDGSAIVGNNIVGGIFAEIAPNGSEQKFDGLNVENVAITGVGGVGGIVGLLTTGTVENVSVKNVVLTGKTEYQGNAMGRIRLGSVAGLMGSQYATIANEVIENVTAKNLDGNAVELPVIGANYDAASNATEAKIGNTYYNTLLTAVNAVKDGETISLLADVTVANKIVINESITLDGNGKTLTYTGTDRAIDVPNDANANLDVTIKNLNLVATTANRGLNYNENGKFNVEGVTVTIGENVDGYAINFPGMADGAQVTIKDSKLTSRNPLNIWGENMVINVYDSEIISVDNSSTYDYAAIQLNNEIPTVGPNGAIANGTVVNVYGGTITALNDEGEPSNVVANATETGVVNISDETVITGKVLNYVANIGGAYFGSLQAAVNAIEKHGYNSPIVIMKSFATSETATVKNGLNVTIDLAGKTITVTDNTTKNFEAIKNQGTLTIKDSSADKTGKITVTATTNSGWNRYSAVIANTVGGKLTVDGGTFEHLGGTDMAYGIDNLTNGKGTYAETIINGGTIKSPYRAIRQFLNGTEAQNILTINGGTIEGANKSVWMQDPNTDANTGTLTVAKDAELVGDVYLFVTAGSTEWPVEVAIAENALAQGSTVKTANLPEGIDVQVTEGVYGKCSVVASIGDTRYQTFAEALDAVQDGETITLVENAIGDEKSKEKEFIKDIEFTITGKAPQYALPIVTFQNATVNIVNAEFQTPELDARQNATIYVDNSTIVDAGGNSIVKSYYNGKINITNNSTVYAMQVTTMGYINIDKTSTLNATWQTNVYGNGMITLSEGATFNTAALHLTAQDYSGRDNTDADRVGKPATIVVDGADFTVGKVLSAGGADYSYNSSKGVNVGTIDGKNAILDIKNGANVNIWMANGETANFGAGATVNVAASTLNVLCRAADGVATLANAGTVNVSGESNLDIKNFSGNAIAVTNATLKDLQFGGRINAFGTNNISGTSKIGGILSLGYETNPTEQVVVNITGNFNGTNVIVNTNNGVDNLLNVGAADGERTTAYFGQLGGFADVNINNADVTYHYAFIRNDFNVTKSALAIAGGVNTYISGNAKVVLDNTTWSLPGFANIGSYGGYNYGNADVTLKNGSTMTATNLGIELQEGYSVNVAIDETSSLTATNLTNQGVMNIAGTVTASTKLANTGTINFTSLDAKLVTPTEGIVIKHDGFNEKYKIVYKDGVYSFGDFVAEINGVYYETIQSALQALTEGATLKFLNDVTVSEAWDCRYTGGMIAVPNVTIDGNDKTLTLTGEVSDPNTFAVFRVVANNATFKNLTIDASEAEKIQRGITASLSITVENCKFIGNGTTSRYGVIYGEGAGNAIGTVEATITGSEFVGNSYGVSDNRNGQDAKSVTVTGNTFTNSKVLLSAAENVTFNGNTVSGASVAITSYSNASNVVVNANDNTLDAAQANQITTNPARQNVQGGFAIPVATSNNVYYLTLPAAIEAVAADAEITMLSDVTGAGAVINKNLTINFNDKTYTFNEGVGSTGTESNGFQILKDNTVTLKNGTLNVAEEAKATFYTVIQNYANLTVENMNLDGTNLDKWSLTDGDSYVLSINSGNVVIKGNTNITANNDGDKAFAFDACDKTANGYTLPVVTVETTGTIEGLIESTATIVIKRGTYTMNVTQWCADGLTAEPDGNGYYKIVTGVTFIDGQFTEYTNTVDMDAEYISYTRNFSTVWTPFYVPFEVPVSQLAEQFEVAYINGVRRNDTDYDGELDEFEMEVIYIHGGNADGSAKTLKANYPYFVRSKTGAVEAMNIMLQDTKLYAASDNTYTCTTMTEEYKVTGNNRKMTSDEFVKGQYIVSADGWTSILTGSYLNPFRFYLTVSSRYDSDTVVPMTTMSIAVRGEEREDGSTFIYDVEMDGEQSVDYIYDLQGRRVLEPQKGGLYIVNGKKVLF